MLDLLFPNVCAGCDRPSQIENSLCGECISEVRFISEFSSCDKCGTPFGFFYDGEKIIGSDTFSPAGEGHLCGKCLKGRFRFERARSALLYDAKVKDMIHEFKYRGRLDLESFLSCLMLDNFNFAQDSFDLIVPVPMHKSKLREREYNQSAILANILARSMGVKCDLLTLKKVKDTRPQFEIRNEDERRRNVRGAFSVAFPDRFRGKSLLLVDDVFTTGSTCDECAGEILESGAAGVYVYTLSRATRV